MSDAPDISNPHVGRFSLKGKLGPLPVWAWGSIIGVLLVVVFYIRSRNATTADNSSGSALTNGALDTTDAQQYQTDGIVSNLLTQAQSTDASSNVTNATWLVQASSAAATKLGKSPSQVNAILQKYLDGGVITVGERPIVDSAISQAGYPPEGTNGTPSIQTASPKPATPVVTAPATPITVTPASPGKTTTGTPKPAPPAIPNGWSMAPTSYGQKADDLYMTYLGRHVTGPGGNPNMTTAAKMLAEGKSQAYVIAWIKKSAEYKKTHPKG